MINYSFELLCYVGLALYCFLILTSLINYADLVLTSSVHIRLKGLVSFCLHVSRVLCTGYEAVERCRAERRLKYRQLWCMRTRILDCTFTKTGTRSSNRSENHSEEVNSFCERRPRWNVRTFHPSRRADTSIRITAALSRTLAVVLQVSGSRGCIWSYNCSFMTGAFEITRHDSLCDLSFVQHKVRLLFICWRNQHQQYLGLEKMKYNRKKEH